MELEIKKALYCDWEFIRQLRNEYKQNFINQQDITKQEHHDFMLEYGSHYYIAYFESKPVGFVGVKDNDIRFAVHSDYRGKSIGMHMLIYIKNKYPKSFGKVLNENIASNNSFKKAGFNLYGKYDKFTIWNVS